jgi:hypothetical protein
MLVMRNFTTLNLNAPILLFNLASSTTDPNRICRPVVASFDPEKIDAK